MSTQIDYTTIVIYYAGMNDTAQPKNLQADTWQSYENNFPRCLLGVSHYLQTQTMHLLQQECGHQNLRLGFAPYITLLGTTGKRLTDLATILGISKQACNQAANQIEAAGYIARTSDPDDSRAKQLVLTRQGLQLRSDGVRIIAALNEEFVRIAGQQAVFQATKTLARIHSSLSLGLRADHSVRLTLTPLAGLLPGLANYVMRRLMELTQARGHPGLKLSFGQVLTMIGPYGGRIQQIAATHDVSKQAISVIANELESLGYLQRDPDPADARQVVLQFTDRGRTLIADSVASVFELEAEFASITSKPAIQRVQATFRMLYHTLQQQQVPAATGAAVDIRLLAKQLQQQLGPFVSKQLAGLLLNSTYNQRN